MNWAMIVFIKMPVTFIVLACTEKLEDKKLIQPIRALLYRLQWLQKFQGWRQPRVLTGETTSDLKMMLWLLRKTKYFMPTPIFFNSSHSNCYSAILLRP